MQCYGQRSGRRSPALRRTADGFELVFGTNHLSGFARADHAPGGFPGAAALPILFAATSPQVRGGAYIGPGARSGLRGPPARVRSSDRSHDPELARRLWQVSEEMTGVHFSFPAAYTRSSPL